MYEPSREQIYPSHLPHQRPDLNHRAVTAADYAPPPIFPTDQGDTCDDTSIIYSYAIDTLFDPSYYIGETEEIETKDALTAPDRDKFLRAIQKEIHGKQRP